MKIIPATLWISDDEPCFALTEINRNTPDGKDIRRYQTIRVIRGDWFADSERDLGSRKNFAAETFSIPGGVITDNEKIEIYHSVGELKDIADDLRNSQTDRSELPVTDMATMYQEIQDTKKDRGVNKWMSKPLL